MQLQLADAVHHPYREDGIPVVFAVDPGTHRQPARHGGIEGVPPELLQVHAAAALEGRDHAIAQHQVARTMMKPSMRSASSTVPMVREAWKTPSWPAAAPCGQRRVGGDLLAISCGGHFSLLKLAISCWTTLGMVGNFPGWSTRLLSSMKVPPCNGFSGFVHSVNCGSIVAEIGRFADDPGQYDGTHLTGVHPWQAADVRPPSSPSPPRPLRPGAMSRTMYRIAYSAVFSSSIPCSTVAMIIWNISSRVRHRC
jgi:hypothetical protein